MKKSPGKNGMTTVLWTKLSKKKSIGWKKKSDASQSRQERKKKTKDDSFIARGQLF